MSDEIIRTGLWKKDGNKGPFYSGAVEIDGQEYWVNLYKNDRKESDRHPDLNLALKPKGEAKPKPAPNESNDFPLDDIPF